MARLEHGEAAVGGERARCERSPAESRSSGSGPPAGALTTRSPCRRLRGRRRPHGRRRSPRRGSPRGSRRRRPWRRRTGRARRCCRRRRCRPGRWTPCEPAWWRRRPRRSDGSPECPAGGGRDRRERDAEGSRLPGEVRVLGAAGRGAVEPGGQRDLVPTAEEHDVRRAAVGIGRDRVEVRGRRLVADGLAGRGDRRLQRVAVARGEHAVADADEVRARESGGRDHDAAIDVGATVGVERFEPGVGRERDLAGVAVHRGREGPRGTDGAVEAGRPAHENGLGRAETAEVDVGRRVLVRRDGGRRHEGHRAAVSADRGIVGRHGRAVGAGPAAGERRRAAATSRT